MSDPITGYLACDQTGRIDLHLEYPHKESVFWMSSSFIEISEENIPHEVQTPKWSDQKPIEVHLRIEPV